MSFKIKLSMDNLTIIILLLILGVSMIPMALSLVLLSIVFLLTILCSINRNYAPKKAIKKFKNDCYLWGGAVLLLFLLQVAVLDFNFDKIRSVICIIFAIFIFIIIEMLLLNTLAVPLVFLKAITWFDIIFSIIYIYRVLLNGLPENRDSVLGYVSSNYCAAILYLSYPIIFYYLFSYKERKIKDKKAKVLSYLALALSAIVVLISGSRTAFGIVLLMLASLVFLQKNNALDKIPIILAIVVITIAIWIAYKYIPSVSQLINRGMTAFQGNGVVSNDVRSIIWEYAIGNFKSFNHLIGSGSNIVYQFNTPAHNLFIEILLSCGYLGVFLFLISILKTIYMILRRCNYKKCFFIMQLIFASILVAYVQPFFSTAFTCGIIVWGAAFAIYLDKG